MAVGIDPVIINKASLKSESSFAGEKEPVLKTILQ